MKALSIRQPWAWLILNAGKDIENREWGNTYPALHDARRLRASGERFLIHTGSGMTRDEYEDALDFAHHLSRSHPFPAGLTMPSRTDLPRGGFVGSAVLASVVSEHPSPWFFGPIGLVLADVRPLPFIQAKGALGFFDVPYDVIEAVRRELAGGRANAR